jgi:hypothetical protein
MSVLILEHLREAEEHIDKMQIGLRGMLIGAYYEHILYTENMILSDKLLGDEKKTSENVKTALNLLFGTTNAINSIDELTSEFNDILALDELVVLFAKLLPIIEKKFPFVTIFGGVRRSDAVSKITQHKIDNTMASMLSSKVWVEAVTKIKFVKTKIENIPQSIERILEYAGTYHAGENKTGIV